MKSLILIIFFLSSTVNAYEFNVSSLISLPGKNDNFDLTDTHYDGGNIFICFENFHNTVYSIYLKQTIPNDTTFFVIASDTEPQINPTIANNPFPEVGIRIVWQAKKNGYWRLLSRVFSSDTLGPIVILTDSLSDNIEPSLALSKLFWINNGDLKFAEIQDSLYNIQTIDSILCSNPEAESYGSGVIYEQGLNPNIKSAFKEYSTSEWIVQTVSDSGSNKNPRFGFDGSVNFQRFQDGFWKAVIFDGNLEWISSNTSYNIENPIYFHFLTTTKENTIPIRDWFVVYESDSLEKDKDIFLEFVPTIGTPKINISNSPGADIKPYSTLINDSIAVFWVHDENGESQIFCAKSSFECHDNIEFPSSKKIKRFSLQQNFPNPFNPKTNISFYLYRTSAIILNVYDIRGCKIHTIISDIFQAGHYNVIWEGKNNNGIYVPSGLYIYSLESSKFSLSRKMLLIR